LGCNDKIFRPYTLGNKRQAKLLGLTAPARPSAGSGRLRLGLAQCQAQALGVAAPVRP